MGIGSFFEYPEFEVERKEDSIFNYLINQGQNHTFLRDGRQAIKAALLNISDVQNKLCYLPKYLCESILQPFRELELNIRFYGHIHPLKPKIDIGIEKSILFIIDYFGVESVTNEEIVTYLEKNNIVIMDNTHSAFNKSRFRIRHENYYLISSLRKIFPIPDGGVIYYDNPRFIVETSFPTGYDKMLKAMKLKSLKNDKTKYLEFYRNYEYQKDHDFISLQNIPEVSLKILQQLNFTKILQKRNSNLNYLYENLINECFLYKKEEIRSPFFLPLLFQDEKQRNRVKTHLIEQ